MIIFSIADIFSVCKTLLFSVLKEGFWYAV